MTPTNSHQATTTQKIKLPEWVYKNLNTFGNCALPNKCNKLNRKTLKEHLEEKIKCSINIREAIFEKRMDTKENATYLIAEVGK